MNFPNVPTRERAQELAPLPRLRALWRQHFPQDIINEREFYAQRRAKRAAYREDKRRRQADAQFNMRLGAASPWESDDDRYLHAYIKMSEEDITKEESDDGE